MNQIVMISYDDDRFTLWLDHGLAKQEESIQQDPSVSRGKIMIKK